jgi:hypothetical protein
MNSAMVCALTGAAALAIGAGAGCSPAEQETPPSTVNVAATRATDPGTAPPAPDKVQAANIDCTTLPNPVYMPTTTLVDTLMKKVLPTLADGTGAGVGSSDQMTVIQFPLSSCNAYEILNNNTNVSGTGVYYDAANATPLNCDLAASANIKADLVAMDVGGQTCLGATPPATLKEFPSHVETLAFVVPKNSTQTSITATEAYYLMKFAGAAGSEIAPWTDPNFIHVRHGGSSTQLTIGSQIGLSGTMWNSLLQSNLSSTLVQNAVIADNSNGNHEKSIGILNSSKYEASLNDMKVLAYQPYNQCIGAIYPDSTAVARDKKNVRDGHYTLWTNLRYVMDYTSNAPSSDNGSASATRTKRFIDIMTGESTATNLNVSLAVIQTGNTPACAMHVKRDFDGGDEKPFEHAAPCDCYFEASNGITNPNCTACTGTCATGVCRSGYCEPR